MPRESFNIIVGKGSLNNWKYMLQEFFWNVMILHLVVIPSKGSLLSKFSSIVFVQKDIDFDQA